MCAMKFVINFIVIHIYSDVVVKDEEEVKAKLGEIKVEGR
jgi:hypothetical protein